MKIHWGSTLNPSWSNFKCLWITVRCMQRSRGCCHIEFGSAYLFCFRERQKKKPSYGKCHFCSVWGRGGGGRGGRGESLTGHFAGEFSFWLINVQTSMICVVILANTLVFNVFSFDTFEMAVQQVIFIRLHRGRPHLMFIWQDL